jgi:hypothetical protein
MNYLFLQYIIEKNPESYIWYLDYGNSIRNFCKGPDE